MTSSGSYKKNNCEKSFSIFYDLLLKKSGVYIFHFNPPPGGGEKISFFVVRGKKYDQKKKEKRGKRKKKRDKRGKRGKKEKQGEKRRKRVAGREREGGILRQILKTY